LKLKERFSKSLNWLKDFPNLSILLIVVLLLKILSKKLVTQMINLEVIGTRILEVSRKRNPTQKLRTRYHINHFENYSEFNLKIFVDLFHFLIFVIRLCSILSLRLEALL